MSNSPYPPPTCSRHLINQRIHLIGIFRNQEFWSVEFFHLKSLFKEIEQSKIVIVPKGFLKVYFKFIERNKIIFKKIKGGAGEVAQPLRVLTAPAEDPGSITSTHMAILNHV